MGSMSEHQPRHEQHKSHEQLVDNELREHAEAAIVAKAEAAKQARSHENLAALSEQAAEHAKASEHIKPGESSETESDTPLGVQQLLKSQAYEHTLRRIQQKLPKSARTFSRIAHNKTVESISNASAQTVARPSGILGGSLCALLGSLLLLYYSRHYGFKYNYSLFFLLFIGGFLVGVLAELALWFLYSRRHRQV